MRVAIASEQKVGQIQLLLTAVKVLRTARQHNIVDGNAFQNRSEKTRSAQPKHLLCSLPVNRLGARERLHIILLALGVTFNAVCSGRENAESLVGSRSNGFSCEINSQES